MTCIRAEGTGDPIPDTSFINWAQDIEIYPTSIFQPSTIDQVVAIIKAAETADLPVHAVGSGWSFNDNFSTPGFSAGNNSEPGYLVRTDALNRILSNTMGATSAANPVNPSAQDPVFQALTGAARHRLLVHVEAGIKVHDLHDALEGMSIMNGIQQPHGFALHTLGGSGGQSLAGVVSTSTHGGDVAIPPIPDMVQGIHLVAPGGVEFFIQRGGVAAIVDTNLLAQLMPCVAGRIVSNNEVFNAVLVSLGRMGIIYSMVIEVENQFILEEIRVQTDWGSMSSNILLETGGGPGTISYLRSNNRFVQVVLLPYRNSSGGRDCFVSSRNTQPIGTPLNPDPSKNDPFSLACRLQPLEKSLVVLGIIAAAAAAAAAVAAIAAAATATAEAIAAGVSWIPFVGAAAAVAAAAVAAAGVAATAAAATAAAATAVALAPLLVPSTTIGDYIASVTNVMTEYGLVDLATQVVNGLLSSGLSPHDVTDLSFKIMDTYDYQANCYKARSLEVTFNADDGGYLDYVNTVLGLIDSFKNQNILYGGYISLRYCGSSEALLAIERWQHTVCIEMSGLSGLSSETQVLNAFEAAATQHAAAIHWGQLNNRTRPDIEAVFADTIVAWREALVRTSAAGKLTTFDNDFCAARGLEPDGVRAKKNSDISYMVPLLLN
jgi:FAD binding domain